MQGVPAQFVDAFDAAQFRQPAHRPGVELYRAHIVRHAFEPHTHEAYGLGAIESGSNASVTAAAITSRRRTRWC